LIFLEAAIAYVIACLFVQVATPNQPRPQL
jgi:hypothetical protein